MESVNGRCVKYPVERLKISRDGISLTSHTGKRVEQLSERFPVLTKKRKVLDDLHEKKVIPAEIYENLCKEFDKVLARMKDEAQELIGEIERKSKLQDEHINTLQLARTFLEIEHGIGNVKDELYQQSLSSILKEMRFASQRRVDLLEIRDKISSILQGEEEVTPEPELEAEPTAEPKVVTQPEPRREEQQAITVRMTQQ